MVPRYFLSTPYILSHLSLAIVVWLPICCKNGLLWGVIFRLYVGIVFNGGVTCIPASGFWVNAYY